jgi:conjugative transfer region protein TrbK
MSARLAFRLAAAGFALVAILVAAQQARRPLPMDPPRTVATTAPRPNDARLARCQSLGAAGAQDAGCLKAWDEARARFLGAPKTGR